MFHLQIELGWSASTQIKALDALNLLRLREGFPGLDIPEGFPLSDKWSLEYDKRSHVVEAETVGVLLSELGIEYQVKRFKGQAKVTQHQTTNIHVALPNLGLIMIDEVELLNDCCTDMLGSHLKDGWRIIAVCPPLDARRPDYVIGRSKYLHERRD